MTKTNQMTIWGLPPLRISQFRTFLCLGSIGFLLKILWILQGIDLKLESSSSTMSMTANSESLFFIWKYIDFLTLGSSSVGAHEPPRSSSVGHIHWISIKNNVNFWRNWISDKTWQRSPWTMTRTSRNAHARITIKMMGSSTTNRSGRRRYSTGGVSNF